MKRLWIATGVLAFLGLAPAAWAQTGSARGHVVDQAGEPVADASVKIEYQGGLPIALETKTNGKGQFTQVGLRPGHYRFTVSVEGYRGTFVEFRVGLGEPTLLPDIKLIPLTAAQAQQDKSGEDRAKITALFDGAIQLAEAGDLEKAQAQLQEAIALRPDFPEAYYNLGYIHIQRQEWDQAEAVLKKAVELRGDYNEALMALSSVYQRTGRNDEAEALIIQTAESGAGDGRVFFNLGVVRFNDGDSAAAQEAFNKAAELDPSNAEVQYYLGTLAVGQGQVDEAIAHLEKYLEMNPSNEQNVATAKGLLQAIKK
jgi:Flp pilus assembly protein TadD